jgi:DNA-binding SARP family transcriptional activator/TolB-like protein
MLVRLRLIGQMEAWSLTSENILPTGRKTRALLAALALASPRPVLRTKLAEMLWSRRGEEQARASLRQEIHRLLEAMAPLGTQVLAINRDHLALRPGTVWVDVDEVLRASPTNPSALSLLDGTLLEDLDGVDPSFDTWLAAERERLSDRARDLAETLLREKTDSESVIPAAQQLLAIDRTHEGAWRALMRAYAGRGERGMAIQAFERCRAVLAEMLDAEPSEETQALLVEIRAAAPVKPTVGLAPSPPMPRLPQRNSPLAEPRETTRADSNKALHRGGARVGVLPLQLVGTSEAEAHLSTGLAEEITTALARFRWMFLVASSSLARFATQARDETSIRRAFNIDFLIDGTVQKAGDQVRISLRLMDLRAGNRVAWSQRFDRPARDLLTLQDEIAAEVVAQIDPEILLIEGQRITARPLADPSAYDLVLRSLPLLHRLEREQFMEAGDLLRQAIAQEPDYAAAHAWYAYWQMFLLGQSWTTNPDEVLAAAEATADRAITLDPQDAKALTIAGHVRAFLHHRVREGITLHERALMVNPNLAMAWNLSGVAHAYLGDVAEAERRVRRYKQLSPIDPAAFYFDTAATIVALIKRDHEAAVKAGRAVTAMNPNFSAAYKPYIAALGHLGVTPEARDAVRRLLAIEPGFTVSGFIASSPFDRTEDRDHYAAGLRLAGVPE